MSERICPIIPTLITIGDLQDLHEVAIWKSLPSDKEIRYLNIRQICEAATMQNAKDGYVRFKHGRYLDAPGFQFVTNGIISSL